jgi:RNA polymerase sigma factor (sigma-70 family)
MRQPNMTAVHEPMNEVDDTTLLDAVAKQRDQSAYAQLFDRYENIAYSLALHVTGNHHAAEEAVQESMLRVWVYADQFVPGSVRAWILQIVSRESLRVFAKRKASKETAGVDMQEPSKSSEPAPDLQGKAELAGALRGALEKLQSADRQLVALHYGGGMSHQEISAQLGIPRRTVSYKIQEALKRLRLALTQAGFAAAVPMLAPEQLGQLLSSGSVAPSLLRVRTLEQVAQGKIQLAQTAARAGKAAKVAKAQGCRRGARDGGIGGRRLASDEASQTGCASGLAGPRCSAGDQGRGHTAGATAAARDGIRRESEERRALHLQLL